MELGQVNNNNNYMNWMRQQQQPQNRYAPHYEVIRVNGAAGANSFQMGPNSSQLLADNTNSDRIWLVMTDGAGYLTAQPYKVIPEEAEEPVDANSLEKRIAKLGKCMISFLDQLNNQRNNVNPTTQNPQLQQIKNMMKTIQCSQNPQLALQNLITQNPSMKNVINMIQSRGLNLQQVAEMMAAQKGVDLNQLIKELQS